MDDARTYTWVADAGSAGAAARSFSRGAVRQPRSRIVLLASLLLAVAIMWAALDDDLGPLPRLLWALVYGAVVVACTLPLGVALGRRLTRRRFAARLAPGTRLTVRFRPTSVELTGPLSRHELSYAGLVHVERVDGWVHIRQLGSPVALVWPGELFPDDELQQMRAAVAARGD